MVGYTMSVGENDEIRGKKVLTGTSPLVLSTMLSLFPNMKRVLTRLQDRRMASSGGGSFNVSGPTSHSKERAAPKKHRAT